MKKKCMLLLCAFVIIFSSINVLALTIIPTPIEIDLGDGLVFWLTLPEGEIFGRPGYPKAGLYRDGELIYSVDANSGWWWGSLHFSDDAMTFFWLPMNGHEGWDIRFYDRGVHIHSYKVISLLEGGDDSLIRIAGPQSLWDHRHYHNRENNTLQIVTVEDATVTFCFSTGLILSIERYSYGGYSYFNSIHRIAGIMGVIILFFVIKYRRKKQPAS